MRRYLKKIIPNKLLTRFILIIVLPIIIAQSAIIFMFYDRHWYNVSYYNSNLIAKEIKHLIDNYKFLTQDHNDNPDIVTEYLSLRYKLYYQNTLPKKQPKLSEELEILKSIINTKIDKPNIIKLKDKRIIILIQLNKDILEISFQSKILINPTTYIFIIWLIALTVILLSISLIFLRNQIRSILELSKVADAFGNGININYKPIGAYEIKKAGLAFLKMKERIDKQIQIRTQMLAMISHDLRTPITRMKLQIEMMQSTNEIIEIKQDLDTMTYMINSYLDFVKGEGGEQSRIVNINHWIKEYINKNYLKYDITIIDNIKQNIDSQINIKPIAFMRSISNIIENSIKYASKIQITISKIKNNICIVLEDNGIGIKDEEKELVLRPFYRSETARTLSDSNNIGLGLAITHEIITNHKGIIKLEDSKELGGLLIRILLPQ